MGPKIENWKQLRMELDILEYGAVNWREAVSAARTFGRSLPPGRYFEVRFERLLAEPLETATELMEFLELPHSEQVMKYARETIDPARAGKRRSGLTPAELDRIMPHINDLLLELQYI